MTTYSLFFVCYIIFIDRQSFVESQPFIFPKQLTNRMREKWQVLSSTDTFQVSAAHTLIVWHAKADRKELFRVPLMNMVEV